MADSLNATPESLEILTEIGRELISELDRDRLLHLIVDRAGRLFDAHGAIYALQDNRLVPLARTDPSVLDAPFALGSGVSGLCAQTRRGVLVNDYAAWPDAVPMFVAQGVTCTMAQPLLARGQLLGVINVSRRVRGTAFAEVDLVILERFALPAALALRNASLYEESERRRRQAEELARIARLLNERLDVVSVCQRIAEGVLTLLPVASSVITLAEPNGDLRRIAHHGEPILIPSNAILPAGVGVTGQAVREGRPVWSADALNDPRFVFPDAIRQRVLASGQRALLAVPLRPRGRSIGALTVADRGVREFTEAEVACVQACADDAAIALDNATLYEEAQQGRREAEVLAEIARRISASLDLDMVLQRVADGAKELCGSDLAQIALREPGSDAAVVRYWAEPRPLGARILPGEGLRGQVLATGRPLRTNNYADDPRVGPAEFERARVRAAGAVALMVVPILIRERVEGLLVVINQSPRPFTDRHEAVLVRLADHAAIAIENARLYDRVRGASERLQALSRRLLGVQEEEHRRLARELHDEIGQTLTATRMNLNLLQRASTVPELSARIDESIAMVDAVLDHVRNLSLSLRPSVLDDLGLAAALRWHVNREAARAGLEARVAAEPLEPRPAPDVETACFRIAQEAMTNIVRHAGARHVHIGLQPAGAALELTVRDDGRGFDVTEARGRARLGGSLGLLGMEERALLVGGQLEIRSTPGQGTQVRVWLPLRETMGPAASGAEDLA